MEPSSPKDITIETKFQSPPREGTKNPPISPTDSFLSPTSIALAKRFRRFQDPFPYTTDNGSSSSSGNEKAEEKTVIDVPSIPVDHLINLPLSIPQVQPPTNSTNGNPISVILGSSSYHRKLVLETAGWNFSIMKPNIDEKAIRNDDPFELPRLIAVAKMEELSRLYEEEKKNGEEGGKEEEEDVIMIASDQITLFNGVVREKPENEEEARMFLRSYENDSLSTITGVVVKNMNTGRVGVEVDVAIVYWNEIPSEVIDGLVEKGEIFGCSGGFTLEDPLLAPCVRGLEGTVDSVLGLPISSVVRCMEQVLE